MELYQIYSAVDNKDAYADLKQVDGRIVGFINYNEGDYSEEAIFVAQCGYTSKNISETDYVQTIPKMLLFSEKFVNKFADTLKNELEFFLGKIKSSAELVDLEKSSFYTIDEEKFIDYPPVFLKNISGFEFCAKDVNDNLIWGFSDKFKDLVDSDDIKIEFISLM